MATLDPRLIDLIETLTRARLDWLAFELIEGIQAGRPELESEAALARTRDAIQNDAAPRARGEPGQPSPAPEPLVGDDQIDWAADYVGERLDTLLAQLDQSIDTLDLIVEGGDGQAKIAPYDERIASIVVLSGGEAVRKSRREELEEARTFIPALRAGLEQWSAQARGQVST